MRNIFDQYSQPENRITNAFMTALNEDRKLLGDFLRELVGVNAPGETQRLSVLEQQYPEEDDPELCRIFSAGVNLGPASASSGDKKTSQYASRHAIT